MWDVASSRVVAEYEAHSKRIWSLDYCTAPAGDPSLLASASDDCTVKLWSTRSPNSVAQVRALSRSWQMQQGASGGAHMLPCLFLFCASAIQSTYRVTCRAEHSPQESQAGAVHGPLQLSVTATLPFAPAYRST